jgi:hypothetical protein
VPLPRGEADADGDVIPPFKEQVLFTTPDDYNRGSADGPEPFPLNPGEVDVGMVEDEVKVAELVDPTPRNLDFASAAIPDPPSTATGGPPPAERENPEVPTGLNGCPEHVAEQSPVDPFELDADFDYDNVPYTPNPYLTPFAGGAGAGGAGAGGSGGSGGAAP